jgi:hypothetical protein
VTALSPELLADGVVTLAGAAGLALFGRHLRHETARGPAHGPFRFAIAVLLTVLVTRLGFWITGWTLLDLVTFLAAALLPLAALLIVEALLRRHAPLPLKAGAVAGALALWAAALLPSVPRDLAVAALAAFQVSGFAALGLMVLRRDRASLSEAENAMVDRLALSFLLILPLALTDFRLGPLDAPVRMSGIAILFLCWLAVGLRQHGAGRPREILVALAALGAAMLAAGLAVAAIAGLDARTTVQVVAVFAAVILLAQVHLGLRQVRRDAGSSGLLHYLATAPAGDPEVFLEGLRRVGPTARAALLSGPALGDFDARFAALFDADPLLSAASRRGEPAAAEQADWFFARFDATHAIRVGRAPLKLLAVNLPAMAQTPELEDELRLVARLAAAGERAPHG